MSQASMTIVGVLRVLPAGAVIADVVLGALLEQHGLRLGERCGRFLRLPGRDGVEPLVEQLALLAGPLARLGERPGVDGAEPHFARQRLPCLAGVPVEAIPEDPPRTCCEIVSSSCIYSSR
jgi:hypothetical protein